MRKTIGITGPRTLTQTERQQVQRDLQELIDAETCLHVCCARGVDELARYAGTRAWGMMIWRTEGYEPWQLQQRSKRMVDALAAAKGTLHAWPNKPCPDGVTVSNWQGSGTWGTMRYAKHRGVPVSVHWVMAHLGWPQKLPDWLRLDQQTLDL